MVKSTVNKHLFLICEKMDKICKHCKKKVTSSVGCEVCNSYYHPSCALQAKVMNKENQMICCKSREKSEAISRKKDEIDDEKLERIVKQIFKDTFKPFQDELHKDMQELKNSVQFMSDSFDDQKSVTEKLLIEVKQLRDENITLNQRLQALEQKASIQEQKERQNNIIVTGIPGQENENTKNVIQQVFRTMALNIPENADCYRIKQKKDGPILVKLPELNTKTNVFKKVKELKGLKVNECGLIGQNGNIFFNEDLTVTNQILFRAARTFRKENNFVAAFCRNGRIFLKKTIQEPAIQIKSEQDLSL